MAKVFRFANARRVLRTLTKLGRAFAPLVAPPPAKKTARRRTAAPVREANKERAASFTERHFNFEGVRHTYWLFLPSARPRSGPPPVLVMLHGCKQDAADFARGTGMNTLAEQDDCIVIYPEQSTKSNGMRCWNWFEPRHQQRDAGEPALLAALTQRVCARERADATRIYIAGLSAGGAMASVVAHQYPDVFAAVGIHSGLAEGAAHDVMSAMRAMRVGADPARSEASEVPVPTIVFHGAGDRTVHPSNGALLVESALESFASGGQRLSARKSVVAGFATRRKASRTIYTDAQGQPQIEFWDIEAAPHAWSGGQPEGSFTDPSGPDASSAMLNFMLAHSLQHDRRALAVPEAA